MNKKLIVIFFFLISTFAFSSTEQRRRELIGVINEEIREIHRLNKQIDIAKLPDIAL